MTSSTRTLPPAHQRFRTGAGPEGPSPVLGDGNGCATGRFTVGRAPKRRRRALPCVPTSREEVTVLAAGLPRRCHAQCKAAEVLTTVCVRSAPTIERPRRLRAGEGPPVRAPPAGRAAWSGAAEVEAVSGANVRRFK